MKIQFSLVIRTTSECEANEFEITSDLQKYLEEKYKGDVFIKNMFLGKKPVRAEGEKSEKPPS